MIIEHITGLGGHGPDPGSKISQDDSSVLLIEYQAELFKKRKLSPDTVT
jgi:hypothetical protein